MLPLRFQIISVAQHSRGAIEAVQSGEFRPPSFKTPYDYAGLQGLVAQTREALAGWTPDAVNALGGRDVVFHLGDHKLPFTAEGFLMSFSLPNFYFHATTAYDILRTNGVPLGKRDFMGRHEDEEDERLSGARRDAGMTAFPRAACSVRTPCEPTVFFRPERAL